MGSAQRRMRHHLSSLKSQRGPIPLLITYAGAGAAQERKVRWEEACAEMATDGLGELDWMRALQEASSLEIVTEKFTSKTFSCSIV